MLEKLSILVLVEKYTHGGVTTIQKKFTNKTPVLEILCIVIDMLQKNYQLTNDYTRKIAEDVKEQESVVIEIINRIGINSIIWAIEKRCDILKKRYIAAKRGGIKTEQKLLKIEEEKNSILFEKLDTQSLEFKNLIRPYIVSDREVQIVLARFEENRWKYPKAKNLFSLFKIFWINECISIKKRQKISFEERCPKSIGLHRGSKI